MEISPLSHPMYHQRSYSLSQGEVARVLSGTFSAESWTPARVANFVRLASNPAIARRTSGTRARGARRSIERA